MKLHKNIKLYRDAIRFTAQEMNLRPEYIEKDYWVTNALSMIFTNGIGKDVIFKGGTALSKCYNMIDRFSEDIDLVILRHEGETDSKLKSKLKILSSIVEVALPEVNIEGITHKRGMNRKTAHSYSKEFKGEYGQVRDVIILESTWLGYHEPYTTRTISSFVGKMMLQNGQANLTEEYGLLPFSLFVLQPIRTICEKIMSLVRFSYTENPMDDLKKKIRHTYDLHQLLTQNEFSAFLKSSAFDKMLLKVANDDILSFKNNNKWLSHHPTDAMVFKDLETVWKELIPTYLSDFRPLVYGEFPREDDILKTLQMIQHRLGSVSWSIK